MSEIRRDPAFSGAGESSEQIQGHPTQRETQIERLQDQLADLLYPSDGGEIDSEALDALLKQMEAVCPLPASLSTDPKEGLERFYRRYASVIDEANAGSSSEATPAVSKKRHSIKLFARALPIAAVLILLFGTVTAQAFGLDVFSAIARWTAEVFRLDGGSTSYATVTVRPLEVDEEAVYESLAEAVAAFGIDAPIVPKKIPEGFELVEVRAAQIELGVLIYADYKDKDRIFQVRYNEGTMGKFNTVEREDDTVDSYFVHGIRHYLFFDLGLQKAVWQNGDFECCMQGYISEQEMKRIIDSIY